MGDPFNKQIDKDIQKDVHLSRLQVIIGAIGLFVTIVGIIIPILINTNQSIKSVVDSPTTNVPTSTINLFVTNTSYPPTITVGPGTFTPTLYPPTATPKSGFTPNYTPTPTPTPMVISSSSPTPTTPPPGPIYGDTTLSLGEYLTFEGSSPTISLINGQVQWEQESGDGIIYMKATQNGEPLGITRLGNLGITSYSAITCQQIETYSGFMQGLQKGSQFTLNYVFLIELHELFPDQSNERFGKGIVISNNNNSIRFQWTLYPVGC